MKRAYPQHCLAWLAAALQIAGPCWAAGHPIRVSDGKHVGILRAGELGSAQTERAYRIVEKRLQRWLENLPSLAAQAEPLGGSVRAEELGLEADHARLVRLAEQGTSQATSGVDAGELESLLEKLAPVARFRPAVQKALVARGERLGRAGKRGEAAKALTAALLLHPDAVVPDLDGWDDAAAAPRRMDLVARLAEAGRGVKRTCDVTVELRPSEATLHWNGFDVGLRRTFQIVSGPAFTLTAAAPGYRAAETVVACRGTERRLVRVQLTRAPEEGEKAPSLLSAISARHGIHSLCLIEPRGNEFKLYLYTPASAMEEIPLRGPLLVADILESPAESEMPIATDAFLSLYERQRGMAGAGDTQLPASVLPARALVENAGDPTSKWYNNSTFWWVTGGVVGGILLTFLLTRGESAKSQPGVTIQLD